MSGLVRLDAASVEAVAARVVELLRADQSDVDRTGSAAGTELIDAAEVARRFGVARSYVYAHAGELGVVRLGESDRPRLRFDPEIVAERLTPCSASRQSEQAPGRTPPPIAPPRRRQPKGTERSLLPIRPPGGGK